MPWQSAPPLIYSRGGIRHDNQRKTRIAPAAKIAPKEMNRHGVTKTRWPIENRYDRNFSSNDIPKLIARWRFLEADRSYHAATAEHPELAKVAWRRHEEEQGKIIQKLEQTVAANFKDASDLLEFAIERLLISGAEGKNASGIRMLRNVRAAIFSANINSHIDAALHEQRAVEEARTQFARIGA
jgi:hypothetical protein